MLFFFRGETHGIIHTYFPGDNISKLSLNQLLTYTRDMIYEYTAFQMIALVLYYAS